MIYKGLALGWAAALTLNMPALAGQASGQFVVTGGDFTGTISPTQAAAYIVRDLYDARVKAVEVVLSSAPVDAMAAAAALQPHTHAINQDALQGKDYVLLWVRPDGRLSMNATFGKTMTQFLNQAGASLQASLSVNTPERVAGRVFSTQPLKTLGGETYTVDLRFDTETSRLPAGTPLATGGGAPGKAFLAFMTAARKKQWPAIKAGLSPATLGRLEADYRTPRENAEYTLDILRAWLPKGRMKVRGGELRGDTADLEIEGDMFPRMPAFYVARMQKNGANWLFDGAALLGTLR